MTTKISTSPKVTKLLETTVPDRLWHYTSFGGLKGIVDTRSIFASDIRFLNDSGELIHARTLLEEIAASEKQRLIGPDPLDYLSTNIGEILKREIQWLFETGPLRSGKLQVFVACFSDAKDQLSQWRGYSNGTSGVSIGFDLRKLRSTLQRQLVVFAPCIYEDDEKRELLRDVIKGLFERTTQLVRLAYSAGNAAAQRSGKDEDRDEPFDEWYKNNPDSVELSKQIDQNRMSAAYDLLHVAALMKHSSFREEREWRLAIPLLKGFNDQDISVFFGTNSYSLLPRTSHDLDLIATPISEIVLGPGSHSSAIDAVQCYMASQVLTPHIVRSASPYRLTT